MSQVENVIQKMLAVKDKTEEAKERESDAKFKLKEVKLEAVAKENEAAGYKRRIQLLQLKLKEVLSETEGKEKTLKELKEKAEVEGERGKELSYAEVETDEQLRTIETKVQDAQSSAENAQLRLNDAQRKLTVMENELSRTEIRRDAALHRIPELEKMIKTAGENLHKMQMEDAMANDREQDYEQKLQLLEDELSKKVKECEEIDRKANGSLRRINELTAEIENWQEKKLKLENEFAAIGELE